MRVTVLGCGAACPAAGENSSGYLVEDQGQRVLLDCGSGVTAALQARLQQRRLDFHMDHIIISHLHPDHFLDLIALRFRITRNILGVEQPVTALHLPPGGIERLAAFLRTVEFPADFLSTVFVVQEYHPAEPVPLGPLRARFAQGEHFIPAWAVRIDGSASMLYSGDTAPAAAIVELGRYADLFLCEATIDQPETGVEQGHCTPAQAARMATEAEARRLLITHFWYDTDRERAEREAAAIFPGPVNAAHDGMELKLSAP